MAKRKGGQKTENIEACSTKRCSMCSCGSWILPILIVVLVWWKPSVSWAPIAITIAAALIALSSLCPCKHK
ncbi:MAG: hypothetical protein WCP89_01965 [archaeon]